MARQVSKRAKIGCTFALLMLLLGGISTTAQVVITPSTPPVVNQGTTFKFTANTKVTWSCPGCAGTIDADGTYHAPASVKSHQSYGGYQLLPNDHIYNTRIDSLPVNSNSATWIAGAGTVPFSYQFAFPINYMNGSTPTASESFLYTPGNNGPFQIPAYPFARIENGWLASGTIFDRHLLGIDTATGTFQEMYMLFSAGALGSQCATCTSLSGVRYPNSTYNLPNAQGGSTDAAGLYLMPLTLRAQEVKQAVATGGTIKHTLRMTLQNGYIQFNSLIWPATATTTAGGGVVPYGARFRLKSSFNISGFSPTAQILLTQLKQYGLILADGGTGWASTVEYTRWDAPVLALFEINNAYIAPSNFEAVDESGLELSATSGATANSETVVATAITNPSQTARQQVVLTGVTLTLPTDSINIQAGAPAQPLTAFVNGSSNRAVTWTMSPTVGTLTSGGLYTPPATSSTEQNATVTATSSADPSVGAMMDIHILPSGIIRLVPGMCCGSGADYVDTHGNKWFHGVGDDSCTGNNNGTSGWPSTPDILLYETECDSYGNDMRFDIYVPNGNYSIDGKFADVECLGVGKRIMDIETQGVIQYPDVDISASAGGCKLPIDFHTSATVSTGLLSYVLRWQGTSANTPAISALEIDPGSSSGAGTPGPPEPPPSLQILVK
jgi:hypothetical protein